LLVYLVGDGLLGCHLTYCFQRGLKTNVRKKKDVENANVEDDDDPMVHKLLSNARLSHNGKVEEADFLRVSLPLNSTFDFFFLLSPRSVAKNGRARRMKGSVTPPIYSKR
jgi:hypothetical protein